MIIHLITTRLAQLGERRSNKAEVTGSIPVLSIFYMHVSCFFHFMTRIQRLGLIFDTDRLHSKKLKTAQGETRTLDLDVISGALYQLSYMSISNIYNETQILPGLNIVKESVSHI
jgi:hypothetical protein